MQGPLKHKQGCGFCRKNGLYMADIYRQKTFQIKDWWNSLRWLVSGWVSVETFTEKKTSKYLLPLRWSSMCQRREILWNIRVTFIYLVCSCMFIAPSTARMGYRDTFPNGTGRECQVHKVKQRRLGNHQPACCILIFYVLLINLIKIIF